MFNSECSFISFQCDNFCTSIEFSKITSFCSKILPWKATSKFFCYSINEWIYTLHIRFWIQWRYGGVTVTKWNITPRFSKSFCTGWLFLESGTYNMCWQRIKGKNVCIKPELSALFHSYKHTKMSLSCRKRNCGSCYHNFVYYCSFSGFAPFV